MLLGVDDNFSMTFTGRRSTAALFLPTDISTSNLIRYAFLR